MKRPSSRYSDREAAARCGRRQAGQHHSGGAQLLDVGQVLLVVVGHRGAGARGARFHGDMDERVLVLQVAGAQRDQLDHAPARLRDLGDIVHVHATHRQQRVGHEGPQRLVDGGVHVESGRLGGGEMLEFEGVDVHGGLPGVAAGAPHALQPGEEV
jgi:hypothetical protein